MGKNLILVEEPKGVTISLRKSQPKRMVNLIASANGAEVEETESAYVIKAPFLKVLRADIETSIGKISDAVWRMLFVNRVGEIKEFNNYEFSIGTQILTDDDKEDKQESVQINVRILKDIKDDMERFRDLLVLTQNNFVEDALREYISNIKKHLV